MVWGLSLGQMEEHMLENGLKENNMAEDHIQKMDKQDTVFGKWAKDLNGLSLKKKLFKILLMNLHLRKKVN